MGCEPAIMISHRTPNAFGAGGLCVNSTLSALGGARMVELIMGSLPREVDGSGGVGS